MTQPVPDLATEMPTTGKGVSSDGLTYTITIRPGAKWNTSPATPGDRRADMVRGVKRTCNPVQPFGGLPDYRDLIVGFQAFCDGFAKVGSTAGRDLGLHRTRPPCPGWSPRTTSRSSSS